MKQQVKYICIFKNNTSNKLYRACVIMQDMHAKTYTFTKPTELPKYVQAVLHTAFVYE